MKLTIGLATACEGIASMTIQCSSDIDHVILQTTVHNNSDSIALSIIHLSLLLPHLLHKS